MRTFGPYTCEHCQKEFTPRKRQHKAPRFCSRLCWREASKGENNPYWRGGTGWYKKQRKAACERCSASTKLLVHHKDEDRTNNHPDNLETLCRKCHAKHHNVGRYIRKPRPRTLQPKECPYCHSTFQPREAVCKFCSRACSDKGKNQRRGSRIPQKPCERCQALFTPMRPDRRYCTKRCAGLTNSALRRAQLPVRHQ